MARVEPYSLGVGKTSGIMASSEFTILGVIYPHALPDDPVVWAAMPQQAQVQVLNMLDHHNPHDRKAWGDLNQGLFETEVSCKCGAGQKEWHFTGGRRKGAPDYTCGYCLGEVDVKGTPMKNYGRVVRQLPISAPAFDGYSAKVLICVKLFITNSTTSRMLWMGQLQGQLQQYKGEKLAPTHAYKPGVSSLKATQYYKLPTGYLVPLTNLGYRVEGQEQRLMF